MCGISGVFEIKTSNPVDSRIIKVMNQAIFKRGPDDEGIFTAKGIGLGNRRLNIIDLTGGHQPILNENKDLVIVFNGEIYNFQKLRETLLKKGHRFTTKSDTEVILHLYEEEGEQCVKKLDGMFAFAIWNRKTEELFLARDPLGKKPLHWCLFSNKLIFSSEIKGILEHPGFIREIDKESLTKYFLYGFIPGPASIFKGVYKLLPGHYLVISKNGKMKEKKYWDISYLSQFPKSDKEEIKKKVIKELTLCVEKRLISDVPLGAFLSGGIDSSLMVAIMSRLIKPSRIESFSIGFKESEFDESGYAKIVAKFLGVNHHLKIFSQKEILDLIPRITDFLDEPITDPSILPTFLLSSFTREKVKVALSGDGGDENFGGYPKYLAQWLLEKYHLNKLPLGIFAKLFKGKYKSLLNYGQYPLSYRNQLWISPFSKEEAEKLTGIKINYEDIDRYKSDYKGKNYLDLSLYLDQKLTLPDQYLVKTDRASMGASLEVRCPFLDKNMVNLASQIPFELKMKGFKTKALLKEISENYLPKEVIYRPKMGFGIPLSKWLKEELSGEIKKYLSEEKIKKEGILDSKLVKNIVQYGTTQQIWSLFIFELWQEKWLKN